MAITRKERSEVDSLLSSQHGVPRVSAAALDKSEAAREKERKHIEQYRALEKEVGEKTPQMPSIEKTVELLGQRYREILGGS